MLLDLLFEFLGEVILIGAGAGVIGAVAIGDLISKDDLTLYKSYANEPIVWEWGDDPNSFNFQDFIGLSYDEVKNLIPDSRKNDSIFNTLDAYELRLSFNEQKLCITAEYDRPNDPKWPYKTNGVFPLNKTYTTSKTLEHKSSTKYPVYIHKYTVGNGAEIICSAELHQPDPRIWGEE